MKKKVSILGLAAALMIAVLFAGIAAQELGKIAGIVTFVLLIGLPLAKGLAVASSLSGTTEQDGMLCMAVQAEIWQNHIEGTLFKDNEFLLASTDASQYVLEGKVVHIPQAGAVPGVVKNRTALPATAGQRTDTDVTYNLDQYTTDPILIQMAEEIESSYSKRESILLEHQMTLRDYLADNVLISWAPSLSSRIVRTTGDATATHLEGTTGTRLRFTTNDLKAAQLAMNKQNIPLSNRACVMSADMFQQLTDNMTETQYRDFSSAYEPKEGLLGRLFGFDIYMRSTVLSYSNATPLLVNVYGAAANADDNDTAICYWKGGVERAVGSIIFRERLNDPTYYGDVYSLEVRFGGRKRRAGQEGIVAIMQAAS